MDTLWLQSRYPSPRRDNGYDVMDDCAVDPARGTLDDFRARMRDARHLGLRVLLDLPLNHTSDQHPSFQAARADPHSPYRPYSLWAPRKPANPAPYPISGPAQNGNWAWDEQAAEYYSHTVYLFMPDLNMAHLPVRHELLKVARFWLREGVHGFRLDALPYLNRAATGHLDEPHGILLALRAAVRAHCPDGVLPAEVDKAPTTPPTTSGTVTK